jgi:hypothetical protein
LEKGRDGMGKIRGEIGGKITGMVCDVTITTWKGIKVAKGMQAKALRRCR